jgi:hypothetical protein
MDVLAPILDRLFCGKGKHGGKLWDVRLSTPRVISSITSTVDWVSDARYAQQVYLWSIGEYNPTESEQFACLRLASSDGACSSCVGANVTEWTYGDDLTVTGCEAGGAPTTEALLAACAAQLTVEVPLGVFAVLFGSTVLGCAGDLTKAVLTLLNDRDAAKLDAHWADVDKEREREEIQFDNPTHSVENHSEVDASEGEAYTGERLSYNDRYFLQEHEANRAKLHGKLSAAGVLLEDGVQLAATFYVELLLKPQALIGGGAAAGLAGFSAFALVSVVAGLINMIFKLVEGYHRARRGILDDIRPQDPEVQLYKQELDENEIDTLFTKLSPRLNTRKLMLEGIGLGDVGIVRLAVEVLPLCTKLQQLFIGGNGISDEGVMALAKVLPQMPDLTDVKIHFERDFVDNGSDISEAAMESLRAAAKGLGLQQGVEGVNDKGFKSAKSDWAFDH